MCTTGRSDRNVTTAVMTTSRTLAGKNRPQYRAVSRNRTVRAVSCGRTARSRSSPRRGTDSAPDPVAALGDGLDDRWIAQLGSEAADGGLHGLTERVGGL